MLIAIDFDNTWTKAPELWVKMVMIFKVNGHRFVCITSREGSESNRKLLGASIGGYMPILFCNHTPKAEKARQNGYEVDVWVDDRPETIPAKLEQWKSRAPW